MDALLGLVLASSIRHTLLHDSKNIALILEILDM